jgi:hypothetical protein
MSKQEEGCAGAGCGCLGLIVLAGIVISAIQAYAAAFDTARLIIGAVVGGLAGAGCAVIAPYIGQGYRKKAEVGPLRWFDCITGTAQLRTKYLGAPPPNPTTPPAAGSPSQESRCVKCGEPVDPANYAATQGLCFKCNNAEWKVAAQK